MMEIPCYYNQVPYQFCAFFTENHGNTLFFLDMVLYQYHVLDVFISEAQWSNMLIPQ